MSTWLTTGTRTAWSASERSIRRPVPFPHRQGLGPQRQRIGIARAQAPGPRILIADECVSTLDVSLQAQILNLFKDPRQEWGIARLFAFHDRDVVSNIRNLAAALHSGRIVEDAESYRACRALRHPVSSALVEAASMPTLHARRASCEALPG